MGHYLDRYAQPEAATVGGLVPGEYANVLVVPCYDEAAGFLDNVLPVGVTDLLVIVVVNAPDLDAGARKAGVRKAEAARNRTIALLRSLQGSLQGSLQARNSKPMSVVPFATSRNVDLLVIDRVSGTQMIPRRQGVGLARKIGADCALALIAAHKVRHQWIYATDADVVLPADYLSTPMPLSGTALFPYLHIADDPQLQTRAELYELHLRYYVNRLAHAGSPYAFHTLGSTMAVHAEAYAKVRGYPRRNAGEDFYLLNKLAKVDTIVCLKAPQITINARPSDRVPFGTGPALARIADDAENYRSYAAASFELLKDTLQAIARTIEGGAWPGPGEADEVLHELGFFHMLENARSQHRRPLTLRKALHQWFDGFRTLRFIHECRRFHEDAPLLDTLAGVFGPAPSRREPRRYYLERLCGTATPDRLGLQ